MSKNRRSVVIYAPHYSLFQVFGFLVNILAVGWSIRCFPHDASRWSNSRFKDPTSWTSSRCRLGDRHDVAGHSGGPTGWFQDVGMLRSFNEVGMQRRQKFGQGIQQSSTYSLLFFTFCQLVLSISSEGRISNVLHTALLVVIKIWWILFRSLTRSSSYSFI